MTTPINLDGVDVDGVDLDGVDFALPILTLVLKNIRTC